jgi:hypothetical protein
MLSNTAYPYIAICLWADRYFLLLQTHIPLSSWVDIAIWVLAHLGYLAKSPLVSFIGGRIPEAGRFSLLHSLTGIQKVIDQ